MRLYNGARAHKVISCLSRDQRRSERHIGCDMDRWCGACGKAGHHPMVGACDGVTTWTSRLATGFAFPSGCKGILRWAGETWTRRSPFLHPCATCLTRSPGWGGKRHLHNCSGQQHGIPSKFRVIPPAARTELTGFHTTGFHQSSMSRGTTSLVTTVDGTRTIPRFLTDLRGGLCSRRSRTLSKQC